MKLNQSEKEMVVEALEHRISDLESWLEETESFYPDELVSIQRQRDVIRYHHALLKKIKELSFEFQRVSRAK